MKAALFALCLLSGLLIWGFLCSPGERRAEASQESVATLLHQLSKICGDRWRIVYSDDQKISITSAEGVLGEAAGYNFPLGERNYKLRIEFMVVARYTVVERQKFRFQLAVAKEAASKIRHVSILGGYLYYPDSEAEWSRVVAVRRAERMVENLPEYSAAGVYLSEEYSMSFFIPNASSEDAKRLKKDMDAIYSLLTKTTE